MGRNCAYKSLRNLWSLALILSLAMLFLSACGAGQGGTGSGSGTGASADGGMGASADGGLGDRWKTEGFVVRNYAAMPGIPEETDFHEVRFSKLAETDPSFAYDDRQSLTAYLREARYELISYTQGGETRLFLERRVSDIEEAERVELFAGEGRKQDGRAACLDAVTEADIAVLFLEGTAGDARYRILHMDAVGEVLAESDVTDGYREQGLSAAELCQGSWWCDGQGYSYVVSDETERLLVFDAEGAFVMSRPCKIAQEGEMAALYAPTAFHAPDGSPVFAVDDPDSGETQLVRLDPQSKRSVVLASLGEPGLRQFTMTENGDIYYGDSHSMLWRWDTRTGEREALFRYTAGAIPTDAFEPVEHVAVTAEGELLVYVRRRTGTELYALSDEEQPETTGIRLADFVGAPYTQSCAADFGRTQDGEQKIQYTKASEDSWARVAAELAAGKGPDLLCFFADDDRIDALLEKGLLADLRGYIPQETLDQVFPGVLASGTRNGALVGLGMECYPFVIAVSKELWQGEQWTVDDILNIMETNPDLRGMFLDGGAKNADANLRLMVLSHLENSPFVDWERGESHFESAEFQRLLEFCAKYGSGTEHGVTELIKEGKCIATGESVVDISNYKNMIEKYGDKANFMGYPGQTDYAGYVAASTMIYVNANTKNPEAVAEFLQYLWSWEWQKRNLFIWPVREDVVRWRCGAEDPYIETDPYMDEYIAFLKKLGPLYQVNDIISNIVREEAKSCFSGDRDAAGTAKIIDNRVQLYLDEQK